MFLICEGATIQLSATDIEEATYQWTGPNGYFSEEQFPMISNAIPGMSGQYSVIGTVSGCSTYPAFTEAVVIPTPVPDLGPDTIFL